MKRKKRKIIAECIAIILAVTLIGCGTVDDSGSGEEQETEKKDSYKLAIVPNGLSDPYMIILSNAAKMQCEALGHEGVVQATSGEGLTDVAGQTELIENIISNGTFDGLVMVAMSAEGAKVSVKACRDAGLPVVMMDNNCDQEFRL